MLLLDLFLTFAKVGVMTFGGGYAMLPILQREVVEKKKWATEAQLADYYAVGPCTQPGGYPWRDHRHLGGGLSLHRHHPCHRRLFEQFYAPGGGSPCL